MKTWNKTFAAVLLVGLLRPALAQENEFQEIQTHISNIDQKAELGRDDLKEYTNTYELFEKWSKAHPDDPRIGTTAERLTDQYYRFCPNGNGLTCPHVNMSAARILIYAGKMRLNKRDFVGARPYFEQIVTNYPDDQLRLAAAKYLAQCDQNIRKSSQSSSNINRSEAPNGASAEETLAELRQARKLSFDIKTAKVGARVAGMTISSIRPSDARKPLASDNAYIEFVGTTTVSGKYIHNVSIVGDTASQITTFEPDRVSQFILPQFRGEARKETYFLLQNSGINKSYSATKSIAIEHYVIDTAPGHVDSAHLIGKFPESDAAD